MRKIVSTTEMYDLEDFRKRSEKNSKAHPRPQVNEMKRMRERFNLSPFFPFKKIKTSARISCEKFSLDILAFPLIGSG